MRPITVSVGPLAAGGVNIGGTGAGGAIPAGQTNLTGATSTTFSGNASWVAGQPVVTITAVTSGVVTPGMRCNNFNFPPGAKIVGLAPGSPQPNGVGSQWIVYPPPAASTSGALRGNTVVALDAPRQVSITTTQAAGPLITIQGTDAAGSPISETLACNGGNLTTSQNFATVTDVSYTNGPLAAAWSVVTAATATTPWVMFDPWADGKVSYTAELTGTANYTVQITNDDPNSPTNPVPPGQVVWAPDPNAGMVGASTNQAAQWQFIPLFARVLLNSGAGSVTATFIQPGVVNR